MIYKKENIDMSLVQCPYEEEQGYIYISDDYTNNVLKLSGYSDIVEIEYYHLCEYDVFKEYLHEYALKCAQNAYHYARIFITGRFDLGEEIIATSSECSYKYSRHILNGRFELGEPVIATEPHFSYLYAHEVLKGRFELVEAIIATNSRYSYLYAKNIIKGRFELGEPIIAKTVFYKNEYQKFTGVKL